MNRYSSSWSLTDLCSHHAVSVSQVSDIIVSALNQNLVEFELKPGVRVIVYNTQLTLGKTFALAAFSAAVID